MTGQTSLAAKALVDTESRVFWTDQAHADGVTMADTDPLNGDAEADLCIIGAGFTGLWAALLAMEDNPSRRVTVLERDRIGFGASSRNGGFCDYSLTHGISNGVAHWPDEVELLTHLGKQNLAAIAATLDRYGIDARAEPTGVANFATASWQTEEIAELVDLCLDHGIKASMLDRAESRGILDSPTYRAGIHKPDDTLLVDPARLAWGLARACDRLGVVFHEHTSVTGVEDDGRRGGLLVTSDGGRVHTEKVLVATNAWAEPIRSIRRHVIPIYDHVLVSEPLSKVQMAEIGWSGREGAADMGNQFHYYRLTADNRILWGGYDANYYYGNGIGPQYESRPSSFAKIAGHFFTTFPQLEDLRFSHQWAGPIGTTSRFTAAWGTRYGHRLAWAAGYTGLGVGASRFGARVALDLLDGADNERTRLKMVGRKPFPFPPEPIRSAAIRFTRSQIARSDRRQGKRGLWLRALDQLGIGFDS